MAHMAPSRSVALIFIDGTSGGLKCTQAFKLLGVKYTPPSASAKSALMTLKQPAEVTMEIVMCRIKDGAEMSISVTLELVTTLKISHLCNKLRSIRSYISTRKD